MLAIIGGTGLNQLPGLAEVQQLQLSSVWSQTPVTVSIGEWSGQKILFLPRHGDGHRLPPHRVNYRANMDALRIAGATEVIGVAAVGGMREDLGPGCLVLPHDIIDYTWGRGQSFCDGESDEVQHIEFHPPYAKQLREKLVAAAQLAQVILPAKAVHGVTQGPRLETAAEIRRLVRDGCDIVGMTGMPEAALAREVGLDYACLGVVVNWAAGIGEGDIHAEIAESIEKGVTQVLALLSALVQAE